jgi:hypothetical protein
VKSQDTFLRRRTFLPDALLLPVARSEARPATWCRGLNLSAMVHVG